MDNHNKLFLERSKEVAILNSGINKEQRYIDVAPSKQIAILTEGKSIGEDYILFSKPAEYTFICDSATCELYSSLNKDGARREETARTIRK